MNGFPEVLRIISVLSASGAIAVGLRSNRSKLYWYAVASLVADIACFLLEKSNAHYAWVINAFVFVQWVLVASFLSTYCGDWSRRYLRLILHLVSLAYLVWTIAADPTVTNLGGLVVLYLLFVLLSLLVFYHLIQKLESELIGQSPVFPFLAGFFLYVSGSLIIFLVRPLLAESDPNLNDRLWIINLTLNIVKNVGLFFSIKLLNHTDRD